MRHVRSPVLPGTDKESREFGDLITSLTYIRDDCWELWSPVWAERCYRAQTHMGLSRRKPDVTDPACVLNSNLASASLRRHPETMIRTKGLSPGKIANLLRALFENELDGGYLSCSNLDSDEDIMLSENDCEESEESSSNLKLIIFQ
ncbi:hypothetical protein TNCV_2487311 [Trichonephila clavipes]|uniref:Uncharacterized protein n=1 Tax=Trichonephila clavipes TaxID=2585209 RepID=A0A8X6W0B4_TRICX|nr:hypothetical protein TNCV_2487311 [Trichonephila clavipes]